MPEDQLAAALTRGIGIRNVNERLQVAYGPDHGLELKSRALGGMEVRIAIPTGERGRQAMRVMSG
jgi:two-component system sensor histidine kinase YesM